jgi:hypothetical protein
MVGSARAKPFGVTSSNLPVIATVQIIKTLTRLDLSGTKVSHAGIEKLKKHLPNCIISKYGN